MVEMMRMMIGVIWMMNLCHCMLGICLGAEYQDIRENDVFKDEFFQEASCEAMFCRWQALGLKLNC